MALDWSDLRFLLAVHRHGSLAGAAKALAVDPTTVGRRLAALEEELGAPLFRRGPRGRVPNDAGEQALALAADVERRLAALAQELGAQRGAPRGVVRLSTVEVLAANFLAPHLPELRARHPDLLLELVVTPQILDLARGDADLALRIVRPEEGGMLVKQVGAFALAVYASADYLAARRIDPESPGASPIDLLAYGDSATPVPEGRWLMGALPGARVVLRSTSVGTLLAACAAGAGAALLPAVLADRTPGLTRLAVPPPPPRGVFRVVHPDLARTPRVRAVAQFLEGIFTAPAEGRPRGRSKR